MMVDCSYNRYRHKNMNMLEESEQVYKLKLKTFLYPSKIEEGFSNFF